MVIIAVFPSSISVQWKKEHKLCECEREREQVWNKLLLCWAFIYFFDLFVIEADITLMHPHSAI